MFGSEDLENTKVKFFLFVVSFLMVILAIFKVLILDEPEAVTRHKIRQRRIEQVLVEGQECDDDPRDIGDQVEARKEEERSCCCGIFEGTGTINCLCCALPWFQQDEDEWNQEGKAQYLAIKGADNT